MRIAIFALLFAAPLFAQHEATQGDLDDGRRLYFANCARCHGPEGADVPGVELGRTIRRASTDEGVAGIIIKGIPNTAMPPHTFLGVPGRNSRRLPALHGEVSCR